MNNKQEQVRILSLEYSEIISGKSGEFAKILVITDRSFVGRDGVVYPRHEKEWCITDVKTLERLKSAKGVSIADFMTRTTAQGFKNKSIRGLLA